MRLKLEVGSRVRHSTYGLGDVEIESTSGNWLVCFDQPFSIDSDFGWVHTLWCYPDSLEVVG